MYMHLQIIEYGISHDIILLMRFLAVIIVFFMAFQVGKKIKDFDIFSTTTGFVVFLITLGLFHFLIALPNLYQEIFPDLFYYSVINTIFLIGMLSFIFFTELDQHLHGSYPNKVKVFFPLSFISLFGVIILGILALFLIISIIFVFMFLVIPLIIVTSNFLKPYESFEIIKRSKVKQLFFLGISLAGLSNFLITDIFFSVLGYWVVFFINTILIISGGLLMTWTWNQLPSLSELDWMVKMDRLLVVHLKSSRLMYHYDFKLSEIQMEGDLVSSVIGGINVILKEILSSNGYIKEIYHGDKNIIFSHGVATACILITSGFSSEFNYRLRMFHLSFEKQFGGENLENWKGDLKRFQKADYLISQFFA